MCLFYVVRSIYILALCWCFSFAALLHALIASSDAAARRFPCCPTSQESKLRRSFRFVIGILYSLDTSLALESIDEPARAAVVLGARSSSVKLALDALGERLAEFDTPLIERVDVPDGTFCEGDVLVVCDEGTESARCDLLGEDAGSWAIAQEDLVWNELVRRAFCLHGVWSLADHESLCLGEVVGCQHDLMLVVFDGVVRLGGEDEVGWDKLGALV